jgi:hypothetical protein
MSLYLRRNADGVVARLASRRADFFTRPAYAGPQARGAGHAEPFGAVGCSRENRGATTTDQLRTRHEPTIEIASV